MKKHLKVDIRLLVIFSLFLILCNVIIFLFQKPDMVLENNLYQVYEKQKDEIALKSKVFVINIPSDSDGSLDANQKNELDKKRLDELRYLTGTPFLAAKGVFILGTDLLEQPVNERECIQTFRDAGNVFWRYNIKNISYYHNDDKCCQIKFLDSSDGSFDRFNVYGEAKYDKY